jgi:hypothetical protein
VRPQLEIRKIVAIVFHRFAYGHSAFHMANYFNMGASKIQNYVGIVCDVLIDTNKLCTKYINIPSKN